MEKTAFVTGGTGFIGRHLVRDLLAAGWRVRSLVPESERARTPTGPDVEVFVGDVTSPESLRGTMDGVDAVFHAAALVESWIPNPHAFTLVNVGGTEHMIAEAVRSSARRFIFTSSLSGIGVIPGQVMREDSPPGRIFGPYEESKAEAERLVARAVVEHALPAVTLIPSIVIGPGDLRNTGRVLLSHVRGESRGRFAEDSVLPVVDVDDVARAHVLAQARGRVGERYIISSENVLWGDLLQFASEVSGTPPPSLRIGDRTIWLASRIGEMLARVTGTPPPLPAWLADFLLTGAVMDNTKSVTELGMSYRPIRETILRTINWFRDEGLFVPPPTRPFQEKPGVPVENPRAGPEVALERLEGDFPRPGPLGEGRQRRRPKPPKETP